MKRKEINKEKEGIMVRYFDNPEKDYFLPTMEKKSKKKILEEMIQSWEEMYPDLNKRNLQVRGYITALKDVLRLFF